MAQRHRGADSLASLVHVTDQGPGIAAADLPKVFERFYRGSSGGEGHGLGLYIAASLARLNKGSRRALHLGWGSTFTLRLGPLSWSSHQAPKEGARPSQMRGACSGSARG